MLYQGEALYHAVLVIPRHQIDTPLRLVHIHHKEYMLSAVYPHSIKERWHVHLSTTKRDCNPATLLVGEYRPRIRLRR